MAMKGREGMPALQSMRCAVAGKQWRRDPAGRIVEVAGNDAVHGC
jgi:hypothetical protein